MTYKELQLNIEQLAENSKWDAALEILEQWAQAYQDDEASEAIKSIYTDLDALKRQKRRGSLPKEGQRLIKNRILKLLSKMNIPADGISIH